MISLVYDERIQSPDMGDFIGKLSKVSDNEIEIYIRTPGGDFDLALTLADFINKSDKEITLCPFGQISSAGFHLLQKTNCKKRLIGKPYSIMHRINFDTSQRDLAEANWHNLMENASNEDDEETYKYLKSTKQFTSKELKDFQNHKDIYIDHKRLHKLFVENGN